MNSYILDTSALLAYIENEEGVAEIEDLFGQALDEKVELFVSVISRIEVLYVSLREQGEIVARERLKLLDDLPIIQEAVDERLTEIIAAIKATRTMSFADSCIAGLAKYKQAILVHKDPEYEQIKGDVQQLKLPYKKKAKSQ
jgi:predicted nucleic acid-binding protein